MSSTVKDAINKNKPHFLKYKKYLTDNDWTQIKRKGSEEELKGKSKSTVELREEEFRVQNELVKAILERLKTFVKKHDADRELPSFKSFVKETVFIIELHTNRADNYTTDSDLTKIKDIDLRTSEIAFHNVLFKAVSSIEDTISGLNIKEDSVQTDGIIFHDNKKAQLAMHDMLAGGDSPLYPEINTILEKMGIDFTSLPKNEMLIYMDSVPKWNTSKHYWEQEKETLQFYVDEFKKIRNGIIIDGVHIEPWLYYHLNIFVTSFPDERVNSLTGELELYNKIDRPPARDNEWWVIQDNYSKAKKEGLMLFLAATRRAAKTTLLASHLDWCATIGKLNILCAGGSTKDLDQIEANFKITTLKKNPAFKVYNINDDWTKKIELGLKKKDGKNLILSILHIINLNKGGSSSSEILAGYTPDAVVIDEIMKVSFIDQLAALKPALGATTAKRCVVILSGTAGNEELAKDAFKVLSDPAANDVLGMQWDILNSRVDPEDRTWKERKFGTFIPGQMCQKQGLIKKDSNLAEFLKKPQSKNLEKIKIKTTNWKLAKEVLLEARRQVKGDHKLATKEKLYHPIDPEEMLLSSKTNPFPYEEGKKHLARIREEGLTGRKMDVSREGGKIVFNSSDKELPQFPHGGGYHDSPVIIFGETPTEKPPRGLYVASLDDYKQEQADSDSLGCFVIYKRQSGNDEYGDRIAAIYTSRPDPHSKFHRWGHMLLEAYNAECLMENEDMEFKLYLDTIKQTETYLVPSFNVAGDLVLKSNNRRTYGISPSGNKSTIINKAVNYAKATHKLLDENGEEYTVLGIELINDEMLLEEMINYREGENHDRITTFGIALIQAHYLDATYVEARLREPVKRDDNFRISQNKLFTHTRRKLF
jgi:hypothetical protein